MNFADIPAWAVERGRTMNHFPAIVPAQTALLVIDMQNFFIAPGQLLANPHARDTVPNINRIAARAAGGHVMWSRHTAVAEGPGRLPDWAPTTGVVAELRALLRPGLFGHAVFDQLDVGPDDVVFDKYRYSAFYNAAIDLDRHLRDRGIDTVIIVGTVTNCCCETTARDALMRDYRVLFVCDATSAVTDAEHAAGLLNLQLIFADVRTTAETLALLEKAEKTN